MDKPNNSDKPVNPANPFSGGLAAELLSSISPESQYRANVRAVIISNPSILKSMRSELKLSQRKLAKLAGVSDATVGFIERGQTLPSEDVACAIFEALFEARLIAESKGAYNPRQIRVIKSKKKRVYHTEGLRNLGVEIVPDAPG